MFEPTVEKVHILSRGKALRKLLAVIVVLMTGPATAQIVRFDGIDPGAGPVSARPNSDSAAAAFDGAASGLGSLSLIDFETLSLGNFSSLQVAPGVTATLSGTDIDGGIVADGLGIWGTSDLGYNTTPGGEQFIGFEPIIDVGTASIEFSFDFPIEAFGAYVTGLGTASGDLFVEFDDGSVQSLPVIGAPNGGVLFFGFTDASAAIVGVTLELANVFGSRDISGVDDVRFVESGSMDIDIMPSDPGNNLNLRAGKGASISVAILSVGGFEAPNLIDPLTLEFGPGQAGISGSPRARDVDGDGYEDLVVKFLTQEIGIACGDTRASLSGYTFDSQLISGSDAINTFNCPRNRKRY